MTESRAEPLPLELGPGWTEGPIAAAEGRFLLLDDNRVRDGRHTPMLVVCDSAFDTIREIDVPGASVAEIAYDPLGGVAYVAALDGIHAIDPESGADRLLVAPPEIDVSPQDEERRLRDVSPALRSRVARVSFHWALALSADCRELFALAARPGSPHRVVRIRVDDGSCRAFGLEGHPGGLSFAPWHGWISQPASDSGARILDLEGRLLAELPVARVYERLRWFPPFGDGAVSPTDHRVALAGSHPEKPRLLVWEPDADRVTELDPALRNPSWSADGKTLYSLRGQHELRWSTPDGSSGGLLIRLAGNAAGLGGLRGSYALAAVPSPSGRYLLARLTRVVARTEEEAESSRRSATERGVEPRDDTVRYRWEHTLCLLDLERRVVRQARRFAPHVAWMRG